MATVHTLGGATMMEAAARAAAGAMGLVGVTVLTSHDPAGYARRSGRGKVDSAAEVGRQSGGSHRGRARAAWSARPQEVARVRARIGPDALDRGSRHPRPGGGRGDQVRVATAAEAVAAGATHLVVGRPILLAADPSAAFRGLLEEAQCIGS